MQNILVVYSSRTGNTKKVAEAICTAAPERCVLKEVKEVVTLEPYKLIVAGYWVDKGGPNEDMKNFLPQLNGKTIALFQTLGADPKGEHGFGGMINAGKYLSPETKILGGLSIRGAIDPKLIAAMSKFTEDHIHAPSAETKARWTAASTHPDEADLEEAKSFMLKLLNLLDKFYK